MGKEIWARSAEQTDHLETWTWPIRPSYNTSSCWTKISQKWAVQKSFERIDGKTAGLPPLKGKWQWETMGGGDGQIWL